MLRIAGIEKESIVDGEGLRYVIFTQGCSHNCPGCHNPETHDFNGGKIVDTQNLIDEILANPLLDGITLSGGDPLFQAKQCIDLVKTCKENNLTVWLYTGFEFEQFIRFLNNEKCDERINKYMISLLRKVDVVVDGPFIESKKTLDSLFRGSSNQRLIDSKKSLRSRRIIEYKIN